MIYEYKAKKGPKEIIGGTIEAASEDAAVSKIIDMGLIPIKLTEFSGDKVLPEARSAQKVAAHAGPITRNRKIPDKEIIVFTRKMRTLTNSNVSLLAALEITRSYTQGKQLGDAIKKMVMLVRDGETFSNSLGRFPELFTSFYINIVKAGEATGNINESFKRILSYLEYREDLLTKVRSSLIYPGMIVSTGIVTIFIIMAFVIPKLNVLFDEFADNIPLITKVLLGISDFLTRDWPLIIGALFITGLVLHATRNKSWQINTKAALVNSLPVIKDVVKNRNLSNFAFSLEALLRSGIGILKALAISAPSIYNPRAIDEIRMAADEIMSGANMKGAFEKRCSYLPDFFIKMIAVGEASGKLDDVLHELAENYKREVEISTKTLTSLIEPIAILVIGLIMGIVVIAMLLPIFEMSFIVE